LLEERGTPRPTVWDIYIKSVENNPETL